MGSSGAPGRLPPSPDVADILCRDSPIGLRAALCLTCDDVCTQAAFCTLLDGDVGQDVLTIARDPGGTRQGVLPHVLCMQIAEHR